MKIYLILICITCIACEPNENMTTMHTNTSTQLPQDQEYVTLDIGNKSYELQIQSSRASITQGMGGIEHLEDNKGMLFCYPQEIMLSYWMKDCLIPLDIAFLDSEGRIVAIKTMPVEETPRFPSERYSSEAPAQYVIEINPGHFKDLDIHVGDQINLPF